MSARRVSPEFSKVALVVHPSLETLAAFQSALTNNGFVVIIARDLPTALLAIAQHQINLAIISSRVQEDGDGWALAGVIHLVSAKAFVCVTSPTDPDIFTLQSAINNGVREVFLESHSAVDIVKSILSHPDPAARERPAAGNLQ
jgi:DNA-binding NtrC family response regulator